MPADAMYADPCAHRYFNYPRPGSIYTLPDIPSLVRGPTVVLLPSGKEMEEVNSGSLLLALKFTVHYFNQ